jgi:tetratricopeptide (TPR) repeat protein
MGSGAFILASAFKTRTGKYVAIAALIWVALLSPMTVEGQSAHKLDIDQHAEAADSATLQGTVRDSDHHPIVGAVVSLQAKGAQSLTVPTDQAGVYRFSGIHPGAYALQAVKAGYKKTPPETLVLADGESKTIDLTLALANPSVTKSPASLKPEFFDEPNFTVAGVTDTTSPGGHGSSVTLQRSQHDLAKETAALSKPSANDHTDPAAQHHLLAENLEQQGKPLGAVREYQRAAELNPSESNIFDWGSELLLHRAAEPAIEVFNRGNHLFPQSVRMLTGLGVSWYAAGSFDQAIRYLCAASDLDPADPQPYLFMGKMQAAASTESPAATDKLQRFAKLQPENALANYYLAISISKRSSYDDAEKFAQAKPLLEKAIRLDPQLAPAYLQLGILYSRQKNLSNAISAYQQAIAVDPQLEQAHYRLAQAYRQTGEDSKARDEMALYKKISNEKSAEAARQQHELQRFVYELKDQTAVQQK